MTTLKKIGFNLTYNEKDVAKLADLTMKLDDCCSAKEYEDAISNLNEVDLFTKQDVREYASLLSMTEDLLREEDNIKRKFRKILRSLVNEDSTK